MEGDIRYRPKPFLYQAVNMFVSAVKLGILTWGSMRIYLLLEPASRGHSRNCSFWHFRIGIAAWKSYVDLCLFGERMYAFRCADLSGGVHSSWATLSVSLGSRLSNRTLPMRNSLTLKKQHHIINEFTQFSQPERTSKQKCYTDIKISMRQF